MLLGSAMRDQDCLDMVIPLLPTEDAFYSPRHRLIWRAILDLHGALHPCDITTVSNALAQNGDLEAIGGRTYIGELHEEAITARRPSSYAEIIRDKWIKRRLIESANELSRMALSDESPASEIIRTFESQIYRISSTATANEPVEISNMIQAFADSLVKGEHVNSQRFLTTRIEDFNQRFKLYYGDYIIIAGEPSMGKTMFGMDLVWHNLGFQKKSLVFSYDQTTQALITRYLSGRTGLTRDQLSSGKLSEKEQDVLCRAAAKLAANGGVYIQDDANLTVYDIWSQARKLKRTVGLDMILIDYVQLIPPHRKIENRNLELADISRILTAMKKDLDVVLVVLSQINRTIKDRTRIDPLSNSWRFPNMHMLRDSGALTQDATMVIFPYIPHEACKREYGEQSETFIGINRAYLDKYGIQLDRMGYVVVDKNKDGETGVVACRRDPQRMRFYSASQFKDNEIQHMTGMDTPF